MKKQNYNFRKCIIKNKKFPKSLLIRVCVSSNKLIIDNNQNLPGRGYYLSRELDKIDNVKLKNLLEKKLHVVIDNETLQELRKTTTQLESEQKYGK